MYWTYSVSFSGVPREQSLEQVQAVGTEVLELVLEGVVLVVGDQ